MASLPPLRHEPTRGPPPFCVLPSLPPPPNYRRKHAQCSPEPPLQLANTTLPFSLSTCTHLRTSRQLARCGAMSRAAVDGSRYHLSRPISHSLSGSTNAYIGSPTVTTCPRASSFPRRSMIFARPNCISSYHTCCDGDLTRRAMPRGPGCDTKGERAAHSS